MAKQGHSEEEILPVFAGSRVGDRVEVCRQAGQVIYCRRAGSKQPVNCQVSDQGKSRGS